ncbi:MAG: hypothetical protein JSS50_02960 [Proteobacteria bacterium]|nr:hypothetical protein [Pseudomonadota bacterium]
MVYGSAVFATIKEQLAEELQDIIPWSPLFIGAGILLFFFISLQYL